ncbi:MAG: spore germination protein GerW family protein [Dehalococcoidia bacterium]
METNFMQPVENIAQTITERLSARTIYGDPVTIDGRTIIPVARISFGFGGGSGRGRGRRRRAERPQGEEGGPETGGGGGGGGGGGMVRPVGFIELTGTSSRWVPIAPSPGELVLRAFLIAAVLGLGKPKNFLSHLLLVLSGQALIQRLLQPSLPPLPAGLRFGEVSGTD